MPKLKAKNLITFGELIKIKREAMNMNLSEAMKRSGITGLTQIEKDLQKPSNTTYQRIIKFYRITDEEIDNCKPVRLHKTPVVQAPTSTNPKPLSYILSQLDDVINALSRLDEMGDMAMRLKVESTTNLKKAHELISEVLIIQRLI